MKRIFLFLLLNLSFLNLTFSQDYVRPLDTLDKIKIINEVQIVGLKSSEPFTKSKIVIDSISNTYQGEDPFFTINRHSPSVFTQSDGGLPYGYSYMRIRGIDQTRINFNLNGIPLNEMEDQGIYFSNMPDFLSNISEIKIQRGVGTSKYGTTSIGGSVDLETESPTKHGVSLSGGAGSFNSQRESIKYSSGYIGKSKIATSISYSKLSSSGFRNNSGTNGETLFGQIGYFGTKNTFKLYGFRGLSRNQMAWAPVTKDLISLDYRTNLNSLSEVDKFGQNFLAATWVNYNKSNLKFSSSIYGNNINGNYTSILGPTTLGLFGLQSYQGGAMSNMDYTKGRLNINSGVNYNYYQRRHRLSDNSLPDEFWYTNFGFKQDVALFTKVNYKFNKIVLFGDIQYRFVDFRYKESGSTSYTPLGKWNFINPKAGVKYIGDKFENWVSISKTSREVTRSDMFRGYDDVNMSNGYLYSNLDLDSVKFIPNYKPEIVYDFEIGTKYSNKRFQLSSNLYFMYFKNERVAYGEVNYIGLLRKPVDLSYRTGLEVDGTYVFSKNFRFITNFNYSYNKVYLDSSWVTHSYTPNLIMNNTIEYKYKFLFIGLNGRYVSKTYLDNTQNENLTTSDYYILNLNAGLKGEYLSVYLNLNNLLNTKYYLPGGISAGGLPAYYVGALRNVFVTLALKI